MSDVVLILSGGLDSTTLLYDLINQGKTVHALSFNYGQKHSKELKCAIKTCQKLNVDHKIVDLSGLSELLKSSLTTLDIETPEGHYSDETMAITVVPGRNTIFLSIAAGYAASIGANGLYLGTHSGDHAIYADCRPEYTEAMKKVLQLFDNNAVELYAPYANIDKIGIVTRGLELGIDYSLTWTCYKGKEKACGKCGSCTERLEAFELNNRIDPIEYED
jgi:7-cyano-7-deazaguanine synthase